MNYEANTFQSLEDFQTGQILLIDKPIDWTSFDVVNKLRFLIRKALGVKKIKVGHAGTLDPRATGLLVICTGRMTKQIQFLTSDAKGYSGSFELGATRPSYDMETEIEEEFPTDSISKEDCERQAKAMTGKIQQMPPAYSAKKVNGTRAYKAAREGKEVELKSCEVEISKFELTKIDVPTVEFDIFCSKGTYIRSIASDFGKALNNGAYLASLKRYQSGKFHLKDAMSIEDFEKRIDALKKTV